MANKELIGNLTLTVTGQEMLNGLAAHVAKNPEQVINWLLANVSVEESEDGATIKMFIEGENKE